jgi:hypothetical protein
MNKQVQDVKQSIELALSYMPDIAHEEDYSATICDLQARAILEDCIVELDKISLPDDGKGG